MQIRLLIFFVFLAWSATADAFSGRDYVEKCDPETLAAVTDDAQTSFDRALDAGSCAGFTGGVLNGANLVGGMLIKQNAMKNNFICLTASIHVSALIEKSVLFIKSKPALLDLPAQAGIFEALTHEFPCLNESHADKTSISR